MTTTLAYRVVATAWLVRLLARKRPFGGANKNQSRKRVNPDTGSRSDIRLFSTFDSSA